MKLLGPDNQRLRTLAKRMFLTESSFHIAKYWECGLWPVSPGPSGDQNCFVCLS